MRRAPVARPRRSAKQPWGGCASLQRTCMKQAHSRLFHVVLYACAFGIGAVSSWLDKAHDEKIRSVSASVNGPLCEALAAITKYSDSPCVASFIEGAPILEALPSSGRGKPRRQKNEDRVSVDELWDSALETNAKLLSSHKEDAHSNLLLEKTQQDANAGRMSHPTPLQCVCICFCVGAIHSTVILFRSAPGDVLLASRFGVEQGLTEQGDVKVRPVDDFSASGEPLLLVPACVH